MTTPYPPAFTDLLAEAEAHDFSGWDFSFIRERWREDKPPWRYKQLILIALQKAETLLDMGTGGGEFLASLNPLPPQTVATEAYPPNISIAQTRLQPLGVKVFEVESDEALPFEDETFDLIINRHESYAVSEVYRILKPGGRFITQQVGDKDNLELNTWLQASPMVKDTPWHMDYATAQLKTGGFEIINQKEAFPSTKFYDVGAVVYYLKAVPWQISNFTVETYLEQLYQIHQHIQANGEFETQSHRFLIEVAKS